MFSKSSKKQNQGPSIADLPDESFFNQLRLKEYPRLDELRHTYLDFTGVNLHARSQLYSIQSGLGL